MFAKKNAFLSVMMFAVAFAAASPAHAVVRITEWMYSGVPGEYVEFTNVGLTSVDLTGWSYDDDSRTPGVLDLSAFGTLAAGESVVITEATEADFRAAWSLPNSVKVIGEYTNNLGRNDEINLFDDMGNLVDRLTYGDQNFPGTLRTQDVSGNIQLGALGTNDPSAVDTSFVGDVYGSYLATSGDLGNPGQYLVFGPVPEPASLSILLAGAALIGRRRRR
ncbi:MAG: PEP-CTERM sorting domain-containing protein [Planctomycetes bacterium]|nr:PEP-CTERM sorting domain-containing protein [Planctomycetota bacterium]